MKWWERIEDAAEGRIIAEEDRFDLMRIKVEDVLGTLQDTYGTVGEFQQEHSESSMEFFAVGQAMAADP